MVTENHPLQHMALAGSTLFYSSAKYLNGSLGVMVFPTKTLSYSDYGRRFPACYVPKTALLQCGSEISYSRLCFSYRTVSASMPGTFHLSYACLVEKGVACKGSQ